MIPTRSAPISVQQKSQDFLLWECFHKKKNWLLSNTANGARASAMLYSIIETVKANGLQPYDYLRYALQAIAENPEDANRLLPWSINLTKPAAE